MCIVEIEKDISHSYLPFFEKDVWNLFTRIEKKHGSNDAEDLYNIVELQKKRMQGSNMLLWLMSKQS